jgi:hypothetical protein
VSLELSVRPATGELWRADHGIGRGPIGSKRVQPVDRFAALLDDHLHIEQCRSRLFLSEAIYCTPYVPPHCYEDFLAARAR